MNVFILSTGRSGSTTIAEACSLITNYSSAHESRSGLLGTARLDYPDQHIESDNRLSWMLGRLYRRYGEDAVYVHLKRDENATIRSFSERMGLGIMKAYAEEIILRGDPKMDPIEVAKDYCDTVNSNIALFLKDRSRKMTFDLENASQDFPKFWDLIGAEGDLNAAMAEFDVSHNAHHYRKHGTFLRGVNKLMRIAGKFPRFIRNA